MATALSDSGVNPLVLPPAVEYPVAAPRGLRRLAMLLWAVVVVVDAYWLVVAPHGDWRPWAGLWVSVFVAGLAWRAGPLAQAGDLVWDGAAWWWQQQGSSRSVPGYILVRLDVQSAMLLRFVADSGAAQWFWLERNSNPGHWLALRRAAHAASVHSGASARASGNRAVTP